MDKPVVGNSVVGALLLVLACVFVTGPFGYAQNKDMVIRKGEFPGLWAGHKTKFSIQDVHDNNTFDGVAEYTEGRFAGTKFGFNGQIGQNRSLVVTRYVAGDKQVAEVGPPKLVKGKFVWQGETKGTGISVDGSWPFKLTIPRP